MNNLVTLLVSSSLALGAAASIAAPQLMTDSQMDNVVAGKTLYVWVDTEGTYYAKAHGGKGNGGGNTRNGWQFLEVDCETGTGICSDGGTIEHLDMDFSDGTDYEWVYTAP